MIDKDLKERFIILYEGLDRAYGTWHVKHKARTIKRKAGPVQWAAHLEGKLGIGIIPITNTNKCSWGAIDIDIDDIDHEELAQQVVRMKLPLMVCRSKSGGAHCYMFTKKPVSPKIIRTPIPNSVPLYPQKYPWSSSPEPRIWELFATPGEKIQLNIELDATSWIFHPGHSIQISLAGSDFPNIWPSPYPAENKVWWGNEYNSCLKLPIVSENLPEAPFFGQIEMPLDVYKLNYSPAKSEIIYDQQSGKTTFQFSQNQHGNLSENEISLVFDDTTSFIVSKENPSDAVLLNEHDIQVITKKSKSRAMVKAHFESDKDNFHVTYNLVVKVNEEEKFKRIWSKSFRRCLV